jgi:uncharacterized membrane protein YdjX (TVP38/TMEM64 family)
VGSAAADEHRPTILFDGPALDKARLSHPPWYQRAYRSMKERLVRCLIVVALSAAIAATWWFLPQFRDSVSAAANRARELGPLGPVVLALVYIPAALCLVPGSWLSILGGFLFGWWRAAVAVSVGATLGACSSFIVGRYLARDGVERKLAENPRFQSLDRAVAEQGFQIVFLCRLSPLLPYALLNYGFGLTKLSLPRFTVATWVGMLPGTLVYTYLGAATGQLVENPTGVAATSPAGRALLLVGIIASILLMVVITRIATRALNRATNSNGHRS